MQLPELRTFLERSVGQRQMVQEHLSQLREQEQRHSKDLATMELAQTLLQEVAQATQGQLCIHIQDLVQTAIDSVFPGVYDFRVEFVTKRGRTEAMMYLDKDGERINPMDSAGGGVVDIVAFALRLASWSLGRSDGVIVMDEPFKWVSMNLRPVAGEIVRNLSEKLGLQVIMVTHDEEMIRIADRVFTVDQKRRRSIVHVSEGTPC